MMHKIHENGFNVSLLAKVVIREGNCIYLAYH